MNAFAESPFFFFVDSMSPISSVNVSKDSRKIVELSDTGCDARISVSAILRNTTKYYFSKSAKMRSSGNWRPRCEQKYENIAREKRFRGQNEQDAINAEEMYYMPKDDETGQDYWQEYPPMYEDMINGMQCERKSENRDYRVNPRSTPSRRNHWRQDEQDFFKVPARDRYENGVPLNASNFSRNNLPFQSLFEKTKVTSNRVQSPRFSYCRTIPGVYNQRESFRNQEKTRSRDSNEREDFEETLRNSRLCKDHRSRGNRNDLTNETFQQSHNFINYNSRNVNLRKSNDDKTETIGAKLHSGSCSASNNRQKRTQAIANSAHENVDHSAPDFTGNVQSVYENRSFPSVSAENFKRFVDRAVDKDSLSAVLNESAPKESRPVDEESGKLRNTFWEFISLDEEDDRKTVTYSDNCEPRWLSKHKASLNSGNKTQAKRSVGNAVNSKTKGRLSNSTNETQQNSREMKSNRNVSANNLGKTKLDFEPRNVAVLKLHKDWARGENLKNPHKNKQDFKDQSIKERKLNFGWMGGSKQSLKRQNSVTKSGFNVDRNMVIDHGLSHAVGTKKAQMNFMEKTMACLKRKLDKSKPYESSNASNLSSKTSAQKKVRSEGSTSSRLPIRIGRRLRSRNPIATRFRSNVKTHLPPYEGNLNMTSSKSKDFGSQQSSIRSRTKPKIKSSLAHNDVVMTNVEAAEYSKSAGNVQQPIGIEGYLNGSQRGDEYLLDTSVNDIMVDRLNGTLFKNDQFGVNFNVKTTESSRTLSMTGDQRRNEISSASGRETWIRRKNLAKDGSRDNANENNCVFHLHGEDNIVCNGYCKKDCRRNCCQSKFMSINSRL